MNISQTIKLLEIIKDKYGDQNVYIPFRDTLGNGDGYALATIACMNTDMEVYDRQENITVKSGVIII